jgi:hypothetical protein
MQQKEALTQSCQRSAGLRAQMHQVKVTGNQAAQAGNGQLIGVNKLGSRGLPCSALKKFGHEGILLTFSLME